MNWMIIERIQTELRVRGELDSPGIMKKGLYNIKIPHSTDTLVIAEEHLLNNSTGQRVVCIECENNGFELEKHLTRVSKFDDPSIIFQAVTVRLPHHNESRLQIRSLRKSVVISGRTNSSELPIQGNPALFINGVKAANLKLFDHRHINNIISCVATEPPDVDEICILALEQKKECVIRFET